jgi:hypothetical protein
MLHYSSCANDMARENKRQTITANDVLAALVELEFEEFTPQLTSFLEAYRATEKTKKESKKSATVAKMVAGNKKAAAADEDDDDDDDDDEKDATTAAATTSPTIAAAAPAAAAAAAAADHEGTMIFYLHTMITVKWTRKG